MMAEGQGNGHDSPERDSAWQPSPPPGGDPGGGTPEPDTDPGAADSGASWLPFKMTSPAEDAAQAVWRLPLSEPLRPVLELLPVEMMTLALAGLDGREAGRFTITGKVTSTE